MLTLWLLVDFLAITITVLLGTQVHRRAISPKRRFSRVMWVLVGYAVMVASIFTLVYYAEGYTLYGALFYGCILAGFHAILVASLFLLILAT